MTKSPEDRLNEAGQEFKLGSPDTSLFEKKATQRKTRRQIATGVAGVAIAIAGIVGISAIAKNSDPISAAGENPTETVSTTRGASGTSDTVNDERFVIWLDDGAAPATLAQAEDELTAVLSESGFVKGFNFVDKEDANVVFDDYHEQTLVTPKVNSREDLPSSVIVTLNKATEAEVAGFKEALLAIPGVENIEDVFYSGSGDTVEETASAGDLVVWMDRDLDEVELDKTKIVVKETLDDFIFIENYYYVSKDQTYEEFAEYYSNKPEIANLVSADTLPASYIVSIEDGADDEEHLQELISKLESIPGVKRIQTGLQEANATIEATNETTEIPPALPAGSGIRRFRGQTNRSK